MFEYKREAKRASHPIKSRRWTYRSAHKIESLGKAKSLDELEDELEEDPVTDQDAAADAESDTEDAPTDEELFSTRARKDMEILNILPTDDNSGMEDFGVGMMLG